MFLMCTGMGFYPTPYFYLTKIYTMKQNIEKQIKVLEHKLRLGIGNKYAIANKIKKLKQKLPSSWEEFLSR